MSMTSALYGYCLDRRAKQVESMTKSIGNEYFDKNIWGLHWISSSCSNRPYITVFILQSTKGFMFKTIQGQTVFFLIYVFANSRQPSILILHWKRKRIELIGCRDNKNCSSCRFVLYIKPNNLKIVAAGCNISIYYHVIEYHFVFGKSDVFTKKIMCTVLHTKLVKIKPDITSVLIDLCMDFLDLTIFRP